MKHMTLDEYRETYFTPRSQPSLVTLRRLCKSGRLPARKIGRNWYIDAGKLPRDKADELVDRILQT